MTQAAFSPSEAAMEGFRVAGRNPLAIILWALVILLTGVGIVVLFWSMVGPDIPGIIAAVQGGRQPLATDPVMIRIRIAQLVLSPLSMIVQGVIGAAILRAVLRPADKGFGFLRLGSDEFLQILVRFVISLVIGLTAIVVTVVLAILVGIGIGASASTAERMGPALTLAVVALAIFVVVSIAYASVKLSLAPAMTFDQRKFELFGSWALTRGIFWRLLGAYLLGAIFAFMTSLGALMIAAIGGVITYFATGVHLAFDSHHFSLSDLAPLAPTMIVAIIPVVLGQAVAHAVISAVPAYVYRHLTSPAG